MDAGSAVTEDGGSELVPSEQDVPAPSQRSSERASSELAARQPARVAGILPPRRADDRVWTAADDSRVVGEIFLGSIVPTLVSVAAGIGLLYAFTRGCDLLIDSCAAGIVSALVITALLHGIGTPTVTGAFHTATGGRGGVGWMVLGGGIGLAVGVLGGVAIGFGLAA
jgi:hypothetical protein